MNTRSWLLSLIFIFLTFNSFSQKLSDRATLSVITCGPGTELYSTFGHSAFRLKDPETGVDRVYNYGMFDFNTPGFYLKFIQGKLPYMLGAYNFNYFYRSYQREGRWISEQVLNLNHNQVQQLVSFLDNNSLDANKFYKYDFFTDNCATKIRDVLDENLVSPINYNFSYEVTGKTYRMLLHDDLKHKPWAKFGIDLALGSMIDREITAYDYQFLPQYILESLNKATIDGAALTQAPRMILLERPNEKTETWSTPTLMFWGIAFFAFLISVNDRRKNALHKSFDSLLFLSSGLAGLVLLFLWFGTDHVPTKWNWNFLWLSPIGLLMLVKAFKKSNFLSNLWVLGIILSLILDLAGVQTLPEGGIPMMIALLIRLLNQKVYFKRLKTASS